MALILTKMGIHLTILNSKDIGSDLYLKVISQAVENILQRGGSRDNSQKFIAVIQEVLRA